MANFDDDQGLGVQEIFGDADASLRPPRNSHQISRVTGDLAAVTQRNESPDMTFEQLRAQNLDLIETGNEVLLRQQAKLRQQDVRKAAIEDAAIAEVQAGLPENALEFLRLEQEQSLEEGDSALEFLGVRTIQNNELLADPDLAATTQVRFEEDLSLGLDTVADSTTKYLIFQREVDALRKRYEDEGKLGLGQQFLEYGAIFLLPFYDTQSRLAGGADKGGAFRPGKRIANGINNFWAGARDLSPEQFAQYTRDFISKAEEESGVFGVNETALLFQLEEMQRGSIGVANEVFTDVVSGLDAAVVAAPFFKAATGGIKTLSGVAKATGARHTAVTLDTSAILKNGTATTGVAGDAAAVDEVVEAVRDLYPTGLRVGDLVTDQQIAISGSLSRKLEEIAQLGDELENITTQGRVSGSQLEELVEAKLTRIRNNNPDLAVEDYRVVTDPSTKLTRIEHFLGKKTGGGYASESSAKGAATRRGFTDGVEIVEQDGQYFIKQVDIVEELAPNGAPLVRRPDNSAEVFPEYGPLPKVSAGVRSADLNLPADLAQRSQEAQNALVRIRNRVIEPLEKEFSKLSGKSRKHLSTILTMSRNERKWYTLDEFAFRWNKVAGTDPSEQDFIAYAAAKQINDIDWTVHNNHLYTELARRGVKQVDFNNQTSGFKFSNVKATEWNLTPDQAVTVRMFDVQNNIVRTGKADTPAEEVADLKQLLESGDYQIFRLAEGVIFEGEPVHVVLTPKSAANVRNLDRHQLNYVAGGHTFRNTKFFAKQANRGVYKDGSEYLLPPRTLATYKTEGIGKAHVESINRALEAYRGLKAAETAGDPAAAARTLAQVRTAVADSPFESLENLEDLVTKGKIDYTEPFELVYDRANPSYYDKIQDASNIAFRADEDPLDGTLQYFQSTGRDYYGRKTDGLLSPHEEADVVLDPFKTLSKGIQHAARTQAYDHYANRAIEEWVRAATPYIDRNSLGGISDARHTFFNGRILENVRKNDPQLAAKLDEVRVTIQRQLGVKTPSQEQFEIAKRSFARFIEGSSQGGFRSKLAYRLDDIQSNNPINALNSMVFDAWLGLFDLSQMFVQTQTIFSAAAASPRFGTQAIGMFMPMRWLSVNKSDNVLDYVAKNMQPVHQQNPNDFKNMVRAWRDSGWNNPGTEISYLDHFGNSIGSLGAADKIRRGRRAGRVFFNEAERWNRMVAWQIAWKETAEQFPDLHAGFGKRGAVQGDSATEQFLAQVNKRTNDFSLSMTSASNAKIQQGIFSPITRFMGYQMRMLELLLPKQFGGNPAFSQGAKNRVLASQVLLYGSKGLPFGQRISDVVQDIYIEVTGEELPKPASKFVESGTIDSLLYAISGGDLDTDFAERTGFGRGLDYTFDRLGDGSMASALEFVGGPAYSFSSRYAESVNRVFTYFKGTRGPFDVDAQDAKFVLNELVVKHINSLKRADKAFTIWKLGQVINPKTGRPLFDATDIEGAAALLGIPLYEETQRNVLYNKYRDNQTYVREAAGMIAKLDREALRLMSEGNFKAAKSQQTQAAVLLASYKDDPQMWLNINRSAMTQLGYTKTEWEALIERVSTHLGPEDVPGVPVRIEQE